MSDGGPMLPNFLIIGAARTGTTSLYQNLQSHSEIYLPKSKRPEPHFFFREASFAKGLDWYERTYFDAWAGEKAVGEASTSYFFGEETPTRIAESLPGCRFILMLRDPVQRAFSNYWHSVKAGLETLSFAEAIEAEDERTAALKGTDMGETRPFSYLARSRYGEQMARWLSVFGPEHFCVLLFDDYVRDTASCLRQIAHFLGVAEDGFAVANRFAENRSTPEEAMLDPELEARLRSYFAKDILTLQKQLGRDFSGWL